LAAETGEVFGEKQKILAASRAHVAMLATVRSLLEFNKWDLRNYGLTRFLMLWLRTV
jgi:hypothetical protein